MRRVSVRRGVALVALLAVSLVPVAAFADEGEIGFPPGAPAASAPPSVEGEIRIPPGFWDVVLVAWLEAKIGPPIG
jgi:hypothetical protein